MLEDEMKTISDMKLSYKQYPTHFKCEVGNWILKLNHKWPTEKKYIDQKDDRDGHLENG